MHEGMNVFVDSDNQSYEKKALSSSTSPSSLWVMPMMMSSSSSSLSEERSRKKDYIITFLSKLGEYGEIRTSIVRVDNHRISVVVESLDRKVHHASFQVTERRLLSSSKQHQQQEDSETNCSSCSCCCWTQFHDKDYYLCWLASPTSLYIWNVFPNNNNSQNDIMNHHIPLPLDTSSILPLPNQQGLLILAAHNNNTPMTVVSTGPPTTVRLTPTKPPPNLHDPDDSSSSSPSSPPHSHPGTTNQNKMNTIQTIDNDNDPTLFSLSHPLDEVRPCTIMDCPSSSSSSVMMSTSSHSTTNASNHNNNDHNCYFPFVMENNNDHNNNDPSYFSMEEERILYAFPFFLDGTMVVSYNYITHDYTLWKIVPQSYSKDDWWTLHDQTAMELMVGEQKEQNSTNKKKDKKNKMIMEPFSSILYSQYSLQKISTLPFLTSSFNKVATRLFTSTHWDAFSTTTTNSSTASTTINDTATTTLLLNLLLPQTEATTMNHNYDDSLSPMILETFSITKLSSYSTIDSNKNPKEEEPWVISPLQSKPCLSAIGISTTTHSNSPIRKNIKCCKNDIVDILICTTDHQLQLYRGDLFFINCSIPSTTDYSNGKVIGLKNSLDNRVDLIIAQNGKNNNNNKIVVARRVTISAELYRYHALTENVLGTLETALLVSSKEEGNSKEMATLALCLRADIVQWTQAVSLTSLTTKQIEKHFSSDNAAWIAFSTFIHTFFHLATFHERSDIDKWIQSKTNENDTMPVPLQRNKFLDNSNDDDDENKYWESLLQSEFHHQYEECHHRSMFLGPINNDSISNHLEDEKELSCVEDNDDELLCYLMKSCHSYSFDWLLNYSSSFMKKDHTNAVASIIFDALHLLYEDCKLSRTKGYSWIKPLGHLLFDECCRCLDNKIMNEFAHFYARDLGIHWNQIVQIPATEWSSSLTSTSLSKYLKPPCFFSYIEYIMNHNQILQQDEMEETKSSTFKENLIDEFQKVRSTLWGEVCTTMRLIHRLLLILINDDRESYENDKDLVNAMVEERITNPAKIIDQFMPSISIPIFEALYRCRSDPPSPSPSFRENGNWSAEAFDLIGRPDLAAIQRSMVPFWNNSQNDHSRKEVESNSSILKNKENDNYSISKTSHDLPKSSSNDCVLSMDDPDKDGLVPLESFSSMLFASDNRIHEAARLVRSSRPCSLRVERSAEVTDHDYERLKQEKLLLLCRRVLALPLGRGMMTIGTHQPLPAEPLPIPDICLAGRVPPTNATVQLDTTNCATDMTLWPDFHNGVAAGLRLPHSGSKEKHEDGRDASVVITRTWIVYNKPPHPSTSSENSQSQNNANNNNNNSNNNTNASRSSHYHGGLLMALGLQGHLSSLSMTDVYEYLTQGTLTTTVGMLIGMAANKRGTCDPSVSKMLCLHIPSLLPPSFAAIDVASAAQTAAVTGIGLLYQGSSHRLMTEFLLNEMGKKPVNDQNTYDREGYSLSCGLALGMVNLSRGENSVSDSGGSVGLADLHIEERLHRYMLGGIDNTEATQRREFSERSNSGGNGINIEQERSSRVFEGSMINTNVTAPGAILALGLIFMKTGNKSIAARLSLPDTYFFLDYVRPDFLLLRIIARSLVLWDEVEPSEEWINSQNPSIVKNSFRRIGRSAEKNAGMSGLVNFAEMTVDSMGNDLEKNVNEKESEFPCNGTGSASPTIEKEIDDADDNIEVDSPSICQAYVHIIAGACFGLGLRYAGTRNQNAFDAVSEKLMELRRIRDENDPASLAQRPQRPILDMCLSCCAVSLAMIMAGTGDLDTLRLLRIVRSKCDEGARYGTHMAFGAATGLLFLGGGTCTLGTEPTDIAALLLAFFPRYPISTSDNQYHLQPLRHCYALAVKRRKLEAIDIETSEKVFLPVKISFQNNSVQNLTAPCLLLNLKDMTNVCIDSERYYPVKIDLSTFNKLNSHLIIYVRKKAGHLSYSQDPNAFRSLLIQTGGSHSGSALELIKSFTEDSKLLAYAKYLCETGKNKNIFESITIGDFPGSMEAFCTDILHECLTMEKTEAIPLYLALYDSVSNLHKRTWPIGSIWDLRIIHSYYKKRNLKKAYPILNSLFVASLSECVEKFFNEIGLNGSETLSYLTKKTINHAQIDMDLISCFMVWFDVPLIIPSESR